MRTLACAIVALVALGCDGSGAGSGGNGSNGPFTTGGAPLTLVISANGVAPQEVTVGTAAQLTILNADALDHQLVSGVCAELDSGTLAPGDQRTVTMANVVETCPFHDRWFPDTTALAGTVRVVVDGPGSIGF